MKQKILILFFLFTLPLNGLLAGDNTTYANENRLFHVERSKNKNLVCYDINISDKGDWNISNPVAVYWINREERPGERNGLSAIQKRLAFGYKTLSHTDDAAVIAINACADRPIRIVKQDGHYQCLVQINNQESQLTSIFVKTKESNSLRVEYVELRGYNSNGEELIERIYEVG